MIDFKTKAVNKIQELIQLPEDINNLCEYIGSCTEKTTNSLKVNGFILDDLRKELNEEFNSVN